MKKNQVFKMMTSLSLVCSMMSQIVYPIMAEENEIIEEESVATDETIEQVEEDEQSSTDEIPVEEEIVEEIPEVEEDIDEEKNDVVSSKLNVNYHTQAEIQAYVDAHPGLVSTNDTYATEPSLTDPYSPGVLSNTTKQNSLNLINQIRYIAGLNPMVTLDETYNEEAMAISFVNGLNGGISHSPSRPSQLSDVKYNSLWSRALGGAGSNLASRHPTLGQAIVHGWMADKSSQNNLNCVGHRRWILNPSMGVTGFGVSYVNETKYYALYSWDKSASATQTNVAWPAQVTPVQYFDATYPWSISTGEVVDASTVKVTLTNGNTTWNFSSNSSDGHFSVDNVEYGLTGCIIFRPDSLTSINSGDSFHVKVEYNQSVIEYDVNFFTLNLPHEHSFTSEPEFTWSGDNTKCYGKIKCTGCDESITSEGNVTKTVTDATCEDYGNIRYSTSMKFAETGRTHSASWFEFISPTGHKYTYTSKDENTHTGKCSQCGKTIEEAHTLTNNVCSKCKYKQVDPNVIDGTCGKHATWTFNKKTGELVIKGTGIINNIDWIHEYRDSIKKVVVEEGITELYYWSMFHDCTNLTSVKLPDGLSNLGDSAFIRCSSLQSINLPNSLTTLGSSAFCGCSSLKSITLPSNLEKIESYAFYGCSFTSFTIPNSVKTIGSYAFGNCNGLTTIAIPASVIDVYDAIFANCENLKQINVDSNNTIFSSQNGIMFNKNKTRLIAYPAGISSTSYQVPNGVDSIWVGAFSGCTNLTNIVLPSSVNIIGAFAFEDCSNLKTINLPEGIQQIYKRTFAKCTSLQSITIPNTVQEIWFAAFAECSSLKKVVIPSNVKRINGNYDTSGIRVDIYRDGSFGSCTSLEEVKILNPNIEISDEYGPLFYDCTKLKTVYCDCETNSESYKYLTNKGLSIKPITVDDKLSGYSLSLSNTIGVNFYMSLSNTTLNDSSSKVTFTLPNGTTQSVKVVNATKSNVDGKTYYVFPCTVSAKDLTGNIKADLIANNGIKKSYSYTVEDYANYIMSHTNTSSKEYKIASSLMTYGYYTQSYFGYKTNSLPKTKNTLGSKSLSSYKVIESDNNSTIQFIGARLVLKSNLGLKLYFNKEADIQCNAGKVSIEGNYKVVTIDKVDSIYKNYTVTGNNYSLNYSVASFGNMAMNGSNTNLKNLIQSMVGYYSNF